VEPRYLNNMNLRINGTAIFAGRHLLGAIQIARKYHCEFPMEAAVTHPTGPLFGLLWKYLGDQSSVGDWEGLRAAARRELPPWLTAMRDRIIPQTDEPTQELKEYDPEWARAFSTGTVSASCDHARMLASIKVPVLYTHHFRAIDSESGALIGAASDQQAAYTCKVMHSAGQRVEYR
jgi:hypothetical protein